MNIWHGVRYIDINSPNTIYLYKNLLALKTINGKNVVITKDKNNKDCDIQAVIIEKPFYDPKKNCFSLN